MRNRCLSAVSAMLSTLLFPACRAETPQSPYTPVTTSNPIVLHLSGGQGTGSILFSIAPGRQLPTKIRPLDAVGPSNTVPAGDIQLGDAKLDEDGKSFTLPIKVTASVALDPGKPYTGSIVLFSKDDKDPVNVKIQLEDNLTVAFEVSPTPIAASLNDRASLCQTLHLKNTGKSTITSFRIAGSNFIEPGSGHRLTIPPQDIPVSLAPGHSIDRSFSLPLPMYAGAYAGTLTITPDGSSIAEKSIPVTFQVRGPLLCRWLQLPFICLVFVVAIGFACSQIVDTWFGSGGGLQKAQAFVALRDSQTRLLKVEKQILNWNANTPALAPPNNIVRTNLWIEVDLAALERLFSKWATKPLSALNDASMYPSHADAAESFEEHVHLAFQNYGDASLQAAIGRLDAVPPPANAAGLSNYVAALTTALQAPLQAVPLSANLVAASLSPKKQDFLTKVQNRIRSMNILHLAVVWIVVLITAYLSFYEPHKAFGSLADYMTVFLWSLGLTTTGNQLVAGIRKP